MKSLTEAEALKLFNSLEFGSDYLWADSGGGESVLRVEARRLEHTKSGKCFVLAKGHFFPKDYRDGTFRGTCFPAYATEWTCVTELVPWKGTRPTYGAEHAHFSCEECEVVLLKTDKECPHCGEVARCKVLAGGAHDSTCLCRDCK